MKDKTHTLLLSKVFAPIRVISAKRSMQLLCTDAAKVLDSTTYNTYNFEEWMELNNELGSSDTNVVTEKHIIPIPEILIMEKEVKYKFKNKPRFSKHKVFSRDDHRCGYCLVPVNSTNRTIDHVMPISKGGPTTYDNVVTACKKCNKKKADKTLKELNWKIHHKLEEPTNDLFYRVSEQRMVDSWRVFLK